jgi:hypothetical protein
VLLFAAAGLGTATYLFVSKGETDDYNRAVRAF